MNGVDSDDHSRQRQRHSNATTARAATATTTTTTTTTSTTTTTTTTGTATSITTSPIIRIQGLPKNSSCDEKRGILRSLSFQFSTSLNRGRRRIADVFDNSDDAEQQSMLNHRSCKSNRLELAMYSSTFGVQHYGIMLKQSKRKNRTAKWNKRFFVLKECFLIYYKVSEKKIFEKTRRMNLHPKGIVPLVGCSVVAGQDHGHKNCLLITHTQFKSAIIVCTPDSKAQESWLIALRDATK
ncbi:unnamed protein product, partial [Acanthocheilonema viteae]